MVLRLYFRTKVVIAEESDLTIVIGKKRFLVTKAKVANISQFFSALLNGHFAEASQRTVNIENDHLDENAIEFILQAAHGATETDLLAMSDVQSDEFLEDLGRACHYFHCGYLVPDAFKQFLKVPLVKWRMNVPTNFMPSLLAAYWIGWDEEVRRLFRAVVRDMSVTGRRRENWLYKDDEYIDDIPDFPDELLAALKAAREVIIKRFLTAIGQRNTDILHDLRKGPNCGRHPGDLCVSSKYGFYQYLNSCIDVVPQTTQARSVGMRIGTLLYCMKDEKASTAPCDMEMRWHYSTLIGLWEKEVAPRALLRSVRSHVGKPVA